MSDASPQTSAIHSNEPRLAVRAGAGSGKTTVLVGRIMRILREKSAELDEIVAITFTDKAASEMKSRLRRECRRVADDEGRDSPEVASFWRGLERRMDSARVTTIHGFCSALLRENAFTIGIDPDFAIVQDATAVFLREEVISAALNELLEARDAGALRLAEELELGALRSALDRLLSAQAITGMALDTLRGKTADEVFRYWLELADENNAREWADLRGDADFLGATEALRSLDDACSDPADKHDIQRVAMLRAVAEIMRSEDWRAGSLHLEAVRKFDGRVGGKKAWSDEETLKESKRLCTALRERTKEVGIVELDEACDGRAAALVVDFLALADQVVAAYARAKSERSFMDFDDLLVQTRRVLREHDDVRRSAAANIKHLLIDEFQDTDAIQLEVAEQLTNGPGKHAPHLFLVGDAKQSIYDFRGAEVEVFRQTVESFGGAVNLDANYRTAPNVLDFINDFFESTGLLRNDTQRMIADRTRVAEIGVEILMPKVNDEDSADEQRRIEARLTAARICEMCAGGPVTVYDKDEDRKRPARYEDAAILFSASTAMSIYEEALDEAGVPYSTVSGHGFFRRQEINDVVNVMRVTLDPWDEPALLGALRGPIAALSDPSVYELASARPLSVAFESDARLADVEQNERLARFRGLVQELRGMAEEPVPEFVRVMLERTGIEAVSASRPHGGQRVANLRKLVDLAENFSSAGARGLRSFVAYLERVKDTDLREGDAPAAAKGAVTLSTIHKAKGLEWPIVVIADMANTRKGRRNASRVHLDRNLGVGIVLEGEDGERSTTAMTQLIQRANDRKKREEDARLLYVAMTRARDYLILAGSPGSGSPAWMSSVEEFLATIPRGDDGLVVSGAWRAIVRRECASPVRAAAEAPAIRAYGRNPRLDAAPPREGESFSISVGQLLDRLEEDGAAPTIGDLPAVHRGGRRYDAAGMRRGELVHRFFEHWELDGGPKEAITDVTRMAEAEGDAPRDLESELSEIAERFTASGLRARLAGLGLRKELPFVVRIGEGVVSGVIDALTADGVIVDYKTGTADEARRERYAQQVRLYAHAARTLELGRALEAIVYYTDTGEMQPIDTTRDACGPVVARAANLIATA